MSEASEFSKSLSDGNNTGRLLGIYRDIKAEEPLLIRNYTLVHHLAKIGGISDEVPFISGEKDRIRQIVAFSNPDFPNFLRAIGWNNI